MPPMHDYQSNTHQVLKLKNPDHNPSRIADADGSRNPASRKPGAGPRHQKEKVLSAA
jgi:hypothetical protein